MIYFKMLKDFSNPGHGTHRSHAEVMFLNGLADIITSVGLALLLYMLFEGRSHGPIGIFTIVAMAAGFSFGGALGISKWIGAWRVMKLPKAE